jgi:hypothetical protein
MSGSSPVRSLYIRPRASRSWYVILVMVLVCTASVTMSFILVSILLYPPIYFYIRKYILRVYFV